MCALRCSHQVEGRCWPRGMRRKTDRIQIWSSCRVCRQAGRKGRTFITLDECMSLHQGRIGDSLERRERTPHQKVPGRKCAYPPVRKTASPIVKGHQCRTGCAFYLKPPSHVSIPQKSEWHDGQRCLATKQITRSGRRVHFPERFVSYRHFWLHKPSTFFLRLRLRI